jgi:hypothetical protein
MTNRTLNQSAPRPASHGVTEGRKRLPRTGETRLDQNDFMPCRLSGLTLSWTSIENAATPIPASPVAPVPTRPTAFGHQIDKVRYTNPEQGGLSQDRARGRQYGDEGHQDQHQRHKYAHQNPDMSHGGSVVEGRLTEPEAGSPA